VLGEIRNGSKRRSLPYGTESRSNTCSEKNATQLQSLHLCALWPFAVNPLPAFPVAVSPCKLPHFWHFPAMAPRRSRKPSRQEGHNEKLNWDKEKTRPRDHGPQDEQRESRNAASRKLKGTDNQTTDHGTTDRKTTGHGTEGRGLGRRRLMIAGAGKMREDRGISIAELPILIDHEKVAEFCRARGIRKLSLFGSSRSLVRRSSEPGSYPCLCRRRARRA
jgi:hypothetical protein